MASDIARIGPAAAVLSGVLFVVAEAMYLLDLAGMGTASRLASPTSIAQNVVFLLAGVTLAVAAAVGHPHPRTSLREATAEIGWLLALVGSVLVTGAFWANAFNTPAIARAAPEVVDAGPPGLVVTGLVLSSLVFAIGWATTGAAALRVGVVRRPAAISLIVGAVIGAVPLAFTLIPFGLALVWTGLTTSSRSNLPQT
jgi:hypothetical protein